jgi:cytosine/adenosine deaminase-related metal-dependent hydrolase
VDTLIVGGTVVTCNGEDSVLEADVRVRDERIVEIGPRLRPQGMTRLISAEGCAVMPGMVQAHVHLCQVLMRGMADDLPLLSWLRQRIWPLEAAHDDASLTASAELGLLEAMQAGTTTLLDMGTVHGYDVVFDACSRAGIRVLGGKAMMDAGDGVPRGLRETTKNSLAESDRLRKTWHGKDSGRLLYAYAPRFILSCTEKLIRGVSERSNDHEVLMHSHIAEHPEERAVVRQILGAEDVDVMRSWGFFGPRAVYAHGVQLTDDEARQMAEEGTRIVHCPSANLKLGSGIARVAELDALGVQLALGADGAPCNNNLDPWVELRHAALLAKVRTGVTTLPAKRALRLATIDGARTLGLGDVTGSLEVGKRADLAVVRLDGAHAEPGGDVFSKLVYACTSRDVEHVLCDGVHVVRHGEHTQLDGERVVATARQLGNTLAKRAGI